MNIAKKIAKAIGRIIQLMWSSLIALINIILFIYSGLLFVLSYIIVLVFAIPMTIIGKLYECKLIGVILPTLAMILIKLNSVAETIYETSFFKEMVSSTKKGELADFFNTIFQTIYGDKIDAIIFVGLIILVVWALIYAYQYAYMILNMIAAPISNLNDAMYAKAGRSKGRILSSFEKIFK